MLCSGGALCDGNLKPRLQKTARTNLSKVIHGRTPPRAGLAINYALTDAWYGIVAFLGMWVIVTASAHIFCKPARTPRLFGVPAFPWVPSGETPHTPVVHPWQAMLC